MAWSQPKCEGPLPSPRHGHTAIQELFTDKYADDADDYEYEVEVIARVHISKRSK